MGGAAQLLWRVYPWIPLLFLVDYLVASITLYGLQRRNLRAAAEHPLGEPPVA